MASFVLIILLICSPMVVCVLLFKMVFKIEAPIEKMNIKLFLMLIVATPFVIIPTYFVSNEFNNMREKAVYKWADKNGYEIVSSQRRYRDRSLLGVFSEKFDLRIRGNSDKITVEVGDPFLGYFSSRVILVR